MKKLILGLAVSTGTMMFAQEKEILTQTPQNKEKESIRFGIKGGANASAFDYQELSVKNQKIGFNAGVFINIPLNKKFAIQPEVLYSQLGAKTNFSETENTIEDTTIKYTEDSKVYLNYISVPVMLQMKPVDNFYIEAGPEFSYFLDGKTKGSSTTTVKVPGENTITKTESFEESINKDNVKKFNIGLGLGLGYYFTPNLGINARYVNSLTHIANNAGLAKEDKDLTTNRVFQLGLNYKF